MPNKIKEYENKIKSLSADFELLAHIASHDLRDQLRQAVINLQEMEQGGENDKLIRQTIASIGDVLERIALLREYSYMANFDKKNSSINCNKIMQDSLEELNEEIEESDMQIIIGDLPVIKGYEPHIKKLFSALIANAIKFNDSDEPILNISCEDKQEYWQFKFSDNGIGLDEVYRKFVFALFQRLDPEAENKGYGVGLAFAKKITENHNGKIWFESDGESGVDFYFTIQK